MTVEVMVEGFDEDWWVSYRKTLEERFDQRELVIRAIKAVRV